MNLSLDSRLRDLRHEKGNTQQELASHLGISVQAVSKWERSEGYPDIAILPRLASYYNVSVDDLLGVGEIKKREQIEYYKEKFKALHNDLPERLKLCTAAYKEFPNEPEIVNLHLLALYHDGLERHREEIISMSQWLLKHHNQSGQYFGAVRCLCHAYGMAGDIESAKKYAAMGGRYHGTETQLLIHVLQGEDAVKLCESNIAWLVDLIGVNVGVMLKNSDWTLDQRMDAVRFVCDLYEKTAEISDPDLLNKWKARLEEMPHQQK